MADRTAKVRFFVSVASTSYSVTPGQVVEAGAPGQIGLEEAGRYVSSGAAEWVEVKRESATRKTPEHATTRKPKR